MSGSRSQEVSSFTIIKGSLIEETYRAFQHWELSRTKAENLASLKAHNPIAARSANWLRDVAFVLSRRFHPNGPDRPIVELAKAHCDRQVWRPLLLWHITRDEFLLRDFLVSWLFQRYAHGIHRLRAEDLLPYLESLPAKRVTSVARWSKSTLSRVASGLLRMGSDFGLLTGTTTREFASYHLPEQSFLYLIHAIAERESNAARIVRSPDWRMYLMHPDDVERQLLRLHQYKKLEYEVAGSLAQLRLPCSSAAEYARRMVA